MWLWDRSSEWLLGTSCEGADARRGRCTLVSLEDSLDHHFQDFGSCVWFLLVWCCWVLVFLVGFCGVVALVLVATGMMMVS